MKQEIKERVEKIQKGEVPEGYQKTKVGIIPDDWLVSLTDNVAKRGTGHTPNKQFSSYYNGGIKWISLKDSNKLDNGLIFHTKVEISEEGLSNSSAVLHSKGSVLISRDAGVGKSAIMGNEMAVSQHFITWTCSNKLNNWYLYYYLQKRKWEFERIAVGSTIKTIGMPFFKKYKIPLPPINEQEKIVEILSTWDKAIELKKKLIEEKKVFKSGLRKRLLSGGVRFKEFNGAWQEFKLNEVVKKIKGTVVQASSNGNMPIIDMNYIDCRIPKSYSDNGTIASKDDVLILWDGSGAGKTFTSFEGVVGSTIAILKCNSVNNIFLQQHMDMNLKRIQLIREGSGIPHVPKDLLNYYMISLPESQEQEKIIELLNIVDKDILNIEKELSQLEEQKRGLMQLLLTGTVRVEAD